MTHFLAALFVVSGVAYYSFMAMAVWEKIQDQAIKDVGLDAIKNDPRFHAKAIGAAIMWPALWVVWFCKGRPES